MYTWNNTYISGYCAVPVQNVVIAVEYIFQFLKLGLDSCENMWGNLNQCLYIFGKLYKSMWICFNLCVRLHDRCVKNFKSWFWTIPRKLYFVPNIKSWHPLFNIIFVFIEVCVYNTDSKQNIGLTDHLGHLVFLGALCGVRTVGVFTRKRRPLLALESPALPTILHSPLALPPSYAPEVMRRGWSEGRTAQRATIP